MTVIEESGMTFGPYEDDCLYHIEKSTAYMEIRNRMKIAEFVWIDTAKNRIIVLEAKTSAPRSSSGIHPERFGEYIGEIESKLCNAMDLFVKQFMCKAVPDGFLNTDFTRCKIVFVLVIKNQQDAWIQDVKDELEFKINRHIRFIKIWKCNVIVLNEERARQAGYII